MNLMKILFLFVLINACTRNNVSNAAKNNKFMTKNNVYGFRVNDINGDVVSMSKYKDKILLIINLPSKCELMEPYFKELNALHEKYSDQGLVILAFPCNEFLKQLPSTNTEIGQFARSKNIKFSIFEKVQISGTEASPLWKYLTSQKKFLKMKKNPIWNYTKFIIDRNGIVVNRISPFNPMSIERYLKPYFNKDKSNTKRNRK